MSSQATTLATWFRDEAKEEGMIDDHAFLWRHMIGVLPETDLSGCRILDFGCNRGGFLRTLYHLRPFAKGIGADVAEHSLHLARERSRGLPLEFIPPAALEKMTGHFHYAFSHEVLYLLPDLAGHAATMLRALRPGGVYYAVTGCHTGNPLWPHWRRLIAESANIPACDYSLDDYADAFCRAGFEIEMRPFGFRNFAPFKADRRAFPSVADSLHYYANVKTIFRARKAG